MSISHFLVSQRDTSWQFSYRGDVTAPFSTKEAAIEAAIDAARRTGLEDVRVVMLDASRQSETIWSPQQDSQE